MAYEHPIGTFQLQRNDKGDNEKRPDYRGEGRDLGGQNIEVAAWIKTNKAGAKYMFCTMKAAKAQPRQGKPDAGRSTDGGDDSPF